MKHPLTAAASLTLVAITTASTARAELPMGLSCDKTIKIVAAEIGEVGEYEVTKGMQKEKHTALLKRKKVKPTDRCAFPTMAVGQTVVVRYTGPEVGETEVQCIDLANGNAQVEFPKSIYTVRAPRLETYKLNPYCPTGTGPDKGFPCSKKNTQSERGMEYKEKVLGMNGKKPQHLVDLVFDQPFQGSVPSGARLFCALINRDGQVVIAGTAQYPTTPAPAATDPDAGDEAAPAPTDRRRR